MKRLLLTLTLLAGANALHGMEIEVPKKLFPITLLQTYHHFSEILNHDIAQEILSLQLYIFSSQPGIGEINYGFPQIDDKSTMMLSMAIDTIAKKNGHCLTVEMLKRNLLHRKISICDIKNSANETVLHLATDSATKIILEVANHEVWTLLVAQTKEYKSTALHKSVKWWSNIEKIKLLLDAAGDKAQDLMDIQDQ